MTTKNYKSSTIRGKLRVARMLSSDPALKPLIPQTLRFTRANLRLMAAKYDSIYIKPDIGSQGIGIYKVSRKSNRFRLQSVTSRKQFIKECPSVSAVFNFIKRRQRGGMILQKAVRLDRVSGRPYDVRVMVQRKPGGSWTVTGQVAKVGRPGKIVTNYFQGGEIWTISKLLQRQGYKRSTRNERLVRLNRKALAVSRTLSGRRAGMREMGIDFAFDRSGRLWILEVNSNHPQFHPLKQVDRPAFNRMMAFARSYGRRSSK